MHFHRGTLVLCERQGVASGQHARTIFVERQVLVHFFLTGELARHKFPDRLCYYCLLCSIKITVPFTSAGHGKITVHKFDRPPMRPHVVDRTDRWPSPQFALATCERLSTMRLHVNRQADKQGGSASVRPSVRPSNDKQQ